MQITGCWMSSMDRVRSVSVIVTHRVPSGLMLSRLPGRHNLLNTLAVLAVTSRVGIDPDQVQEALLRFQGVRRRQDVLGEVNGS